MRDFRRWLWSDVPGRLEHRPPLCARHALAAFLRERHGAIDGAQRRVGQRLPRLRGDRRGRPRPVPYVHDCSAACREDLQRFVHDRLLPEWVRAVTTRIRARRPNHLVASPRLAIATRARLPLLVGTPAATPTAGPNRPRRRSATTRATSATARSTCSAATARPASTSWRVNAYSGAPTFARPWFTDGIHKIQRESGLPVLISEFGLRARIDGWSNRGGAGAFVPRGDASTTSSSAGSATAPRSTSSSASATSSAPRGTPGATATSPPTASLQINLGLVQCTDARRGMDAGRRWRRVDDLIADTNRTIMRRIARKTGL